MPKNLDSQKGVTSIGYTLIAVLSNLISVKSQKGVTMIEYALIASLVAIAVIATLLALGTQLNVIFQAVVDALTPAG
ncbi:MAG: Flp family type IVb pilin [Chlorobiaceae bacterium]|nr:Flp family type IVb pilin [Chlorobiaceae bacterium]